MISWYGLGSLVVWSGYILAGGDIGVCVNVDELVGVSRKEIEVLIGDKVVDSELDVSMDLVAGLLDKELL